MRGTIGKLTGKLAVVAILVMFVPRAHAVNELVVIRKPFHARSLAGVVVGLGGYGAPIPIATVEEYDPTFTRVLATTETDLHGRFALLYARPGTTHYLRLHATGFNPVQITVRIRRSGKRQLRLKLPIGG